MAKRYERITILVTIPEKRAIKKIANAAGLGIGEYIRGLIFKESAYTAASFESQGKDKSNG